MNLGIYYRPGSQEWLMVFTMLPSVTVRGKPLDKDQKTEFRLKGKLPKYASMPESVDPSSPDMLPEPVQIMSMPGMIPDAAASSGPYAVHMGGGMYARQIRLRTYTP